jgi:UDP-GlcNAc3NAcA epimerase
LKKIISIIGARPQFIKHAPMQIQLQKHFDAQTIHTGQHYDDNMSAIFFDQLNIPKPTYSLDTQGATSHGAQTAVMMTQIEQIAESQKPDAILVYGDTNSTLAGALVAAKMHIPIIHIESGLRSNNKQMPEEINRIITDHCSALLFCPSDVAIQNLMKEGITHSGVVKSGDVMCDMIHLVKDKITPQRDYKYYFTTLHRPYNTDDAARMKNILSNLNKLDHKVIICLHPRTKHKLLAYEIEPNAFTNLEIIDPVGFIESISFQKHAQAVITDSGGIQKEAYILQKKCITLRSETEWVESLQGNWNQLVFDNLGDINECLKVQPTNYQANLYGDGFAAAEITQHILAYLN